MMIYPCACEEYVLYNADIVNYDKFEICDHLENAVKQLL